MCFLTFLMIFFGFRGSLQTSLLCTVGELAEEGSLAVAIGISDSWHVTGDRWRVTPIMWQVTCDSWHMTCDTWHLTHDTLFTWFFVALLFFISWYWSYYWQATRVLMSPVCRILNEVAHIFNPKSCYVGSVQTFKTKILNLVYIPLSKVGVN